MANGTVTASSLNLRDAPAGALIGSLPQGATVAVLEEAGGWLRVATSVGGQAISGWVSADFVALATGASAGAAASNAIPPADDLAHPVTVQRNKAIGPEGRAFATVERDGFVTFGTTPLAEWLQSNPTPPNITASTVRAVRAVSLNEGKLEAVNSYDNAFLSFGMFQWTAGTGDDPGELAAFLELIRVTEPAAFAEYFGRYSLGVSLPSAHSTTGRITIDGSVLRDAADKEQLRGAEWAYRFWRAGHDDGVRRCELMHAAARIERFYRRAAGGQTIADWLTSEFGVAMVLDEHVNRPGHVPGTLEDAIATLPAGTAEPANWTTAEEKLLIERYIDARNATNLTKPEQRAQAIANCVDDGTLSEQRGSYASAAAGTGV
jgi:hypothetical protein